MVLLDRSIPLCQFLLVEQVHVLLWDKPTSLEEGVDDVSWGSCTPKDLQHGRRQFLLGDRQLAWRHQLADEVAADLLDLGGLRHVWIIVEADCCVNRSGIGREGHSPNQEAAVAAAVVLQPRVSTPGRIEPTSPPQPNATTPPRVDLYERGPGSEAGATTGLGDGRRSRRRKPTEEAPTRAARARVSVSASHQPINRWELSPAVLPGDKFSLHP